MHRPRGGSRPGKVARLALAAIGLGSLGFAACGGGGDDEPEATPVVESKTYTAESLLPDLQDVGLKQSQKQQDPAAAAAGQDSWGAIYTGTYSVQVRTTVLKDEATARSQFDQLAVAFRNPPPEFVGAGVAQSDNTPVVAGGSSKGYVTAKPDQNGRLVWTDVTLIGKAVVIVQVLGRDGKDAVDLRTRINEKITAATK